MTTINNKMTINELLWDSLDKDKFAKATGWKTTDKGWDFALNHFKVTINKCETMVTKKQRECHAEDRCMARTWGSDKYNNKGLGPQCSSKRCGGDYCKAHAKKAFESEEPCLTNPDGTKFGLWCGRIDKPLVGLDSAGVWQIRWLTDDMLEKYNDARRHPGFKKGRYV